MSTCFFDVLKKNYRFFNSFYFLLAMIFPYIMTYCHQIYLQFYTIFSSTIQSVIFLVSFSSLQMFLLFHCFFETSALILHRFSHFFLLLFDILPSRKYVLFLFQFLILYIFLSVSIFHNDDL